MPRHARLDAPGTLHHVMARGIDRANLFADDADRAKFVGIVEELTGKTETRIPAWSIMGNHFHLLVLSGPSGLPAFMRRLMTRYAVYFNRRHHRTGHLFQNRYKSIVCEEEAYFLELVRYIHLNPLKVGVLASLTELDRYPWCGHSAIMGRVTREWQDRLRVLGHFSTSEAEAVRLYRAFLYEGKGKERQPELTGGGLRRSVGGVPRRGDDRVAYDERILGSGDFVAKILNKMDKRPGRLPINKDAVIARICNEFGLDQEQVRNGSRRRLVAQARVQIIDELVNKFGVSLVEVAGLVGISTSGVSNVLHRLEQG